MMQQANLVVCTSLVALLSTNVLAQQPPESMSDSRLRQLKNVVDSIAGTSSEKPRVFKLPDGCVRFLMAPPLTHFPVEAVPGKTPEQVASQFLQDHRPLFVDDSDSVEFQVIQVIRGDPLTRVRYGQRYRNIEVFGAQMLIAVDRSGGIASVTSDIMCHTEWLDTGNVSFTPSVDSVAAGKKAVEFLTQQHPKLEFDPSPAELKVFSPVVVALPGTPKLVWQTTVVDRNERQVKELILVDAHTGEIPFHYSLFPNAKYRRIHDWNGTTTTFDPNVRIEGQDPCGIADVDNAYDYLEDTYDFYHQTNIDRDSWDGAGADLIAEVRYGTTGAEWDTDHIRVASNELTDDTIGHEFTHGVFDTNVPGISRSGETGAIEESFCDMFGEWIDQTNGTGGGSDWYLFEDWASTPWPWRRMDDPTACKTSSIYGNDFGNLTQPDRLYGPGWYWGSDDYGGLHHNLGVGNKLGYLLTGGGSFNGYTISGLGIPKAGDLFYECLTGQLNATSTYYGLGDALQAATAVQSIGLTQSQRTEVDEACRAVEIVHTLMGCWNLDEGSGTTAGDSTPYNRDCTFGGDPAWVGGVSGQGSDHALEFDGEDDAHRDALPALCGGAVTISAWIKATSVSDQYDPMMTQYDGSSGDAGYYLCRIMASPRFI
jgi:Zn-dependent metalloprotease